MKISIAMLSLAFVLGCNQKNDSKGESAPKVDPAPGKEPATPVAVDKPAAGDKPAAAGDSARPERPTLKRGQPLPAVVRTALRQTMRDHGDDMESLLWASLMLDYESTEAIADRMTSSPSFSKPGPGAEGTLNEHMPAAFFTMQDELESNTAALRKAANEKDDAAMATAYSKIASTCITCHSLYLKVPGSE
jgi:hypothetical protein